MEEPILFFCSDDIDLILPAFAKFSPVIARYLQVKLPETMEDQNLELYRDFWILSKCDIVATSNSVFSFAACLLNEHGRMFVRPHWNFSSRFIVFDPWDSEPLLWIGDGTPKFFKSLPEVVFTTYATQGIWSTLKSLFLFNPGNYLKAWVIGVYLGYKIQGFVGVFKTFASMLGWYSW